MPVQNLNKKPIPDKTYFTISEVGKLCDLKPHVLRYWEQEFPSLNPVKREGNRRYYQRKDILLVQQIQNLRNQGFTIEGAKIQLAKGDTEIPPNNTQKKENLTNIVNDLEAVLSELN